MTDLKTDIDDMGDLCSQTKKCVGFNKYTVTDKLNMAIKQLASKLTTLKRNISRDSRMKENKEVSRSQKEYIQKNCQTNENKDIQQKYLVSIYKNSDIKQLINKGIEITKQTLKRANISEPIIISSFILRMQQLAQFTSCLEPVHYNDIIFIIILIILIVVIIVIIKKGSKRQRLSIQQITVIEPENQNVVGSSVQYTLVE